MIFLFVGKWNLGVPENTSKNRENPRTGRNQMSEEGPEGGCPCPRRQGGMARPLAAPGRRLGGFHHLWCPTSTPMFSREEKHRNRSRFDISRRGAAATLCSSPGELIWRLFWPPVRGKSSPSSSPSPLHHHSMTSPLMSE